MLYINATAVTIVILKMSLSKMKRKTVLLSLLLIVCLALGLAIPLIIRHNHLSGDHTNPVKTYLSQPLPFSENVDLIRYYDKRGFDVPILPNKTTLWTQDIQLCIMFNTVYNMDTVGLLLAYYLHFFDHITLLSSYGTKPHFAPDTVRAIKCASYSGWYQHKCLNSCLSHASDHIKGFLYVADDMFLNMVKLGQMDLSKLWFIPARTFDYNQITTMNKFKLHQQWYWFGFPIYSEVHLKKTVDSLPEQWLKALRQNAGFPNQFKIVALFDITYIPKTMAPQMTQVITFISKTTDLFCEVAGPLAIGITANQSQIQLFQSGYLQGKQRNPSMKEKIAKTAHFAHPVKLGKSKEAKLWQNLMRKQLVAVAGSQ